MPFLPFLLLAFVPADAPLLTMDEWVRNWEVSRDFTLAVAQKMPADQYNFKATPEEMSFAQMSMHIAAAIVFRFEQVSGVKAGRPASRLRRSASTMTPMALFGRAGIKRPSAAEKTNTADATTSAIGSAGDDPQRIERHTVLEDLEDGLIALGVVAAHAGLTLRADNLSLRAGLQK
jgi:hypothetical protein